jgi:serine/threonine protein kinase
MALSPGARLGPYEIVAPLGAGGMGEVYRARDARLDRIVAIKVLPSDVTADADRRARFEREVQAVAALSHPNIVAIHDVGIEHGVMFAVMELLEGATLRRELAGGPLRVRKALDYALQIARGLAAAHARGIVHRDLKPENVFVTGDGQVKILDFGLAKALDQQVDGAIADSWATVSSPMPTAPGIILGTGGYLSPEQAAGRPVDQRSDVFSFGCVLHEMVTGRRCFARHSAIEAVHAVLHSDPAAPAPARPARSTLDEWMLRRRASADAARTVNADGAEASWGLSGSSARGTSAARLRGSR